MVKTRVRLGELESPAIALAGERDGPTLVVVAGIHGNEFNTTFAALEVARRADLRRLRGAVLVLPLVDTAAFAEGTPQVCPLDHKNINRVFPGASTGSPSERAALAIFELTQHADCVVDLHCGEANEDISPYAACVQTGIVQVDEVALSIARAVGFPLVVYGEGIPGSLIHAAAHAGRPAIMAEAGGRGVVEQAAVELLTTGVLRVMGQLDMVDLAAAPPRAGAVMRSMHVVAGGTDGLFVPQVSAGSIVHRGERLGRLLDFFGDLQEEVITPHDGIAFLMSSSPRARRGDMLAAIAVDPVESL
jgi:predicted deacylase